VARQVFFSFHYDRDIWRVNQIRKSDSFLKSDQESGYFDHSLWEKTKLQGDDALRRLINEGLKGASVLAVLIGAETSTRRWVNYEITKASGDGMGVLGVYIHRMANSEGKTDTKGLNPLASIGPAPATYDGVGDDGYHNFGSWVEKAAKAAGR
jgi:hypothetical protein